MCSQQGCDFRVCAQCARKPVASAKAALQSISQSRVRAEAEIRTVMQMRSFEDQTGRFRVEAQTLQQQAGEDRRKAQFEIDATKGLQALLDRTLCEAHCPPVRVEKDIATMC